MRRGRGAGEDGFGVEKGRVRQRELQIFKKRKEKGWGRESK